MGRAPVRSAIRAAHDLPQLLDLAALIGLIARGDGVLHAMRDVIAQDFLFQPPKRGAHRRDLGHDVDAVAILLDHARNAAHLALDPAQSLRAGRLDVVTHARYIPLHGIGFNPSREPTDGLRRCLEEADMLLRGGLRSFGPGRGEPRDAFPPYGRGRRYRRHANSRERCARSGLRHVGRPAQDASSPAARWAYVLLLLGRMPG